MLLTIGMLLAGFAVARGAVSHWSVLGPVLSTLVTVPLLLLPWWLPLLLRGYAGGLLLDPGVLPVASLSGLDLAIARVGGLAAPYWPGLVVVVLALASLIPVRTRVPVLICWLLALVTAVAAMLASFVSLPLGDGSTRPGLGLAAVVLQGLGLVVVVIAGTGAARNLVRGVLPRLAGAAVALCFLAVPAAGLVWFAGFADHDLGPTGDQGIPAYMEQSAELGPKHGIAVLTGDLDTGLVFVVRRGDGPTVGEPEIVALTPPDDDFTAVVGQLLSRPRLAVAQALADQGIEYVVLAKPADPQVAAVLDTAPGLEQAGTEDRAVRAWQVTRPLSADALADQGSWSRPLLLVLQALALVLALVLCAPTRRERS